MSRKVQSSNFPQQYMLLPPVWCGNVPRSPNCADTMQCTQNYITTICWSLYMTQKNTQCSGGTSPTTNKWRPRYYRKINKETCRDEFTIYYAPLTTNDIIASKGAQQCNMLDGVIGTLDIQGYIQASSTGLQCHKRIGDKPHNGLMIGLTKALPEIIK